MTDFHTAMRALNSAAYEALRALNRGHDTETVVRGMGPTRTREMLMNIAGTTDMIVDRLPARDDTEDTTP